MVWYKKGDTTNNCHLMPFELEQVSMLLCSWGYLFKQTPMPAETNPYNSSFQMVLHIGTLVNSCEAECSSVFKSLFPSRKDRPIVDTNMPTKLVMEEAEMDHLHFFCQ